MQIKANLAGIPADNPERAKKEKLLAAIEQRLADEDLAMSRTRYMTPARQTDDVFGPYCSLLRHRIEARGTAQFPESNGHKLYGRVTLNLRIDAMGRLVGTDLVRSSGNTILDEHARKIATAAAPFGAFASSMRSQVDEIVYTANFNFVHQSDAAVGAQGASAP